MDGGEGNWRRNISQSTEVSEASHQCHLGPVSSLGQWFRHLKRGEEGADGRRTTVLGVVINLLDGRTVKTRGQRVHAGDPSRKASPLCLPERGEFQGDHQVSKPLVRGRRHCPARENLGPRRWSRCGWLDALGRLSSSLSRAGILSLRGSGCPPCEEPGSFPGLQACCKPGITAWPSLQHARPYQRGGRDRQGQTLSVSSWG